MFHVIVNTQKRPFNTTPGELKLFIDELSQLYAFKAMQVYVLLSGVQMRLSNVSDCRKYE